MTNVLRFAVTELIRMAKEEPTARKNKIMQRWIDGAQETLGTFDMSFHCLECGETMIGCRPHPGSNRPAPCCPECSARMEVTCDDVLRGMMDPNTISNHAR